MTILVPCKTTARHLSSFAQSIGLSRSNSFSDHLAKSRPRSCGGDRIGGRLRFKSRWNFSIYVKNVRRIRSPASAPHVAAARNRIHVRANTVNSVTGYSIRERRCDASPPMVLADDRETPIAISRIDIRVHRVGRATCMCTREKEKDMEGGKGGWGGVGEGGREKEREREEADGRNTQIRF